MSLTAQLAGACTVTLALFCYAALPSATPRGAHRRPISIGAVIARSLTAAGKALAAQHPYATLNSRLPFGAWT